MKEKLIEVVKKTKQKEIEQGVIEDILENSIDNESYEEFVDYAVENKIMIKDKKDDKYWELSKPKNSYYTENTLEQYFQEIASYEVLTPEEEIKLINDAKAGDDEARTLLINSNLKLVAKIAMKYSKVGTYYLDLIQEGTIGLMSAYERFDARKGYRFATYAVWWVKREIINAISAKINSIKIPAYIYLLNRKIEIFEDEYLGNHKKAPTNEEIAEKLEITVQEVVKTKELGSYILNSIEEDEMYSSDNTTLETIDKDIEEMNQKTKLSNILKTLTTEERSVIALYFGLNDKRYTIKEISQILELKVEKVKLLKERALVKLKYQGGKVFNEN